MHQCHDGSRFFYEMIFCGFMVLPKISHDWWYNNPTEVRLCKKM